ncbi:MAG: iron ABC transporter permease [Tissierellia bacterium]|nr:iron ABC transporter permease [Tissierellia bacterium]
MNSNIEFSTNCLNNKEKIMARSRYTVVTLLLICLILWALVLNVNMGSAPIPASEIFIKIGNAIKYKVLDIFTRGQYQVELNEVIGGGTVSRIIFGIRMPRMLLAGLLGGALALSGFLLQTFFRNPMAGPFVLGISSGARMIVAICIIFLVPIIGVLGSMEMVIASFFGSLIIVMVVLVFSRRVSNMSMILVIGIMVGYVCSSVTDFAITFASESEIANLTGWSMGSFSGANWSDVGISSIICLSGLLLAWLLSKPMGAYALGEGYAKSMGVDIKRFRMALILLTSLLSSSVIAFAGPISFVGIAVPHISRSLLGTSKPSVVVPITFLCGALFCIICDLIARTAFAPTELAIGTVTSAFGAPIVIYMLLKRQKRRV